MDEFLIGLTESDEVDSVIDFFRKYMAGFLISKHETSTSVCETDYERGVNDNMADTGDLLCMMYGTTESVRTEDFFTGPVYREPFFATPPVNCTSVFRYESAVSCAFDGLNEMYLNRPSYPDCNDISFDIDNTVNGTIIRFMIDNNTTDISTYNSTINGAFQVDGAVREIVSSFAQNSTFGRRHATFDNNADITGATVYYNNQVCSIAHTTMWEVL